MVRVNNLKELIADYYEIEFFQCEIDWLEFQDCLSEEQEERLEGLNSQYGHYDLDEIAELIRKKNPSKYMIKKYALEWLY